MEDIYVIHRISHCKIEWKIGQKDKIIELYNKGTSMREISRLFDNIHYNTIKKILVAEGIILRGRHQSRLNDTRQEDIFAQIDTEEKAYWLGFIAADGCISNNVFTITLKESDISHLEKLQIFFKSIIKPVLIVENKSCRLDIYCHSIIQDLQKWGITERKSLSLLPPLAIPEEFHYDWIRGYYDGDGGISYSKKSNRWQSYFTSTKEVLLWIRGKLEITCYPFLEHRCLQTYRLHFNGRLSVMTKLNKIYKNNTATIFLDRKYQLYLKLLSTP